MVVGPAVIVSELLTTDVVNPDFVAVSVAVLVFVLMFVFVLVLPMLVPAVLVPAVLVPVAVAVPDPLRLREQAAARFWLPVPATNWFPAAGHM